MSLYGLNATVEDGAWARTFVTLYEFLATHPRSEDATLLLSTCRNAYLTVNAEFADIQALLGGAMASPLRTGLEMIDQGSLDGFKVRSRFDKALGTVAQIDEQERVWTTRRDLHESILQLFDAYQTENELDAICIRDIVRGTDLGPSDPEDGRHAHLLRLDLSEQPHLRTHFEALKRLRDLLEAIARFGMSYADTIPATPLPPAQPATLDLFADCIVESASTSVPQSAQEPGSNGIPANRDLAFWAEKIGLGCEWATESDEAELRVTVEFKHPRPAADREPTTDSTLTPQVKWSRERTRSRSSVKPSGAPTELPQPHSSPTFRADRCRLCSTSSCR